MKLTFNAAELRAVQRSCADKADPREYLQRVLVDFDAGRIVGTDGYILTVAPIPGQPDLPTAGKYQLRLDKQVPKFKNLETVTIDTDTRRAEFMRSDCGITWFEDGSDEAGRYADWQRAHAHRSSAWEDQRTLPETTQGLYLGMNPGILARVTDDRSCKLELQQLPPSSAIRVSVHGLPNLEITFMPARV